MSTITNKQSAETSKYNVVGTRPIRHDGYDKVTGRARFGADLVMAGQLHGRILRSPHAHARILSIDTSKAEALDGVMAVATAKDFPVIQDRILDFAESQSSVRMQAENLLAHDKALYQGHAIAAVAAVNPHIAEEALKLIDVEFEVLPSVITADEAMKEDAPILHDSLTTMFKVDRFGAGDNTGVNSNIASHVQITRGDIQQGFKEADLIIERAFTTQTVHQGYIEPFACSAQWSTDGHLTIWCSTQALFGVRGATSAILNIAESDIKVIPMEIGGGFGGKLTTYLEPVAAVLAKKSGRAVKMVMNRKEVFEATGPTSGSTMRCKIGADKSGQITAIELWMAYEAGAYPGSPIAGGVFTATGPYNIENFAIDGLDVVVNKPKSQAYRAPGQPAANYAVETVLDEIAEKLGIEPLELRIKNKASDGDRAPAGVPHTSLGLDDLHQAMKEHPQYKTPLAGPNQGRGIAIGYRLNGGGSGSSATINVTSNGTIQLITGSMDIGGTRAAVAMQAAEILGIAAEDVTPTVVDTDSVGWTGGTGGSRIAFDTGLAAIRAAEEVIKQMKIRASMVWEAKPEDVEFADGVFTRLSNPEDKLTFKQLAAKNMDTGGPVTCSASDRQGGVGPTFAGNIVDVEVDPETGKVEVLRVTAFMDAGTAVHPSYVEGQMQGSTVQGIGWALNEEYFYNPGNSFANSTFLDYRMPTTLDLPMIDTVIIEKPNPRHPFGLRGVGEIPIVPIVAAVANAVYHATGARVTNLPMSPGNILETKWQNGSDK
jgi:CO/xanthine dehydrogenase Mo-binding subunit